jgi:N-acetylglucosamine-6-phosphate deacetylase
VPGFVDLQVNGFAGVDLLLVDELVARGGEVTGEHGRLAGSTLTLAQAVRNLHALGVPLEDALAAASGVPARLAGRPDLGRLEPGAPADVVVLDDRLEVQRVLLGGVASAA